LILFFIFFCLFFNRKKATRSQADGWDFLNNNKECFLSFSLNFDI
jgi:hypothetical protein